MLMHIPLQLSEADTPIPIGILILDVTNGVVAIVININVAAYLRVSLLIEWLR